MNELGLSQKKSSVPLFVIGFILIFFLWTIFALVALYENYKIAELNDKMYHHPFSVSNAVLEANNDIIAMHRYMKDVVLSKNIEELDKAIALVEQHQEGVYRHFKTIKKRFLGDARTIDAAYVAFVDWQYIRNEVIVLQRNNQPLKAAAITVGKGARHVQLLTQKMDVLIDFARTKALQFKNNSEKTFEESKLSRFGLLIFIFLTGLVTVFFIVTQVRRTERASKKSEERYQGLFNNSDISIWSEDFSGVVNTLDQLRLDGVSDLKQHLEANKSLTLELAAMVKVNQVNDSSLRLFGAANEEHFLQEIGKSFGSNAISVFINELCAIWAKQGFFYSEVDFNTFDGKKIKTILTFQIPTKRSDFQAVPVSIVDITERKKTEEQLNLFSRVFNDTHEGILITEHDGTIIDVNPAFCNITGYSREEVIAQNPRMLSSGRQSPQVYVDLWQALIEKGYWKGEMWNRRKSGELYAELLTISALKGEKGRTLNYVGVFSDITHTKKQQKELELMAHYDVLTKLPNRALFYDRFLQAAAHSKRSKTLLAVCFLDLDNFKPVNDSYGHDVGDELLVEVAERIKGNIREEDTVSRQGGDEFALLLGNIEQTYLNKSLSRILDSLAEPFLIKGQTITISASLGVTLYPQDQGDVDTLIRHADQAMYEAKLKGRNGYRLFNQDYEQEISLKQRQLDEIRLALSNDELCLYYQPKVNMKTGEVYGAEALIRWQDPKKGLIPPLDFLPILEETPLEIQLGRWVIDQALEQVARWEDQGVSLEISVNIAPYHLRSASFVSRLGSALLKHPSLKPHNLQLEVLESSALGDTKVINNIIKSCQEELGVKVALDDFGTGYSSLTHLRNLPVETIKIDQSFVGDMLDDPDDYSIIDGVINLASAFNRTVIAEGVETTEHGLMLLLLGCNYAQGYCISRPLPVEKFLVWMNSYQPNNEWRRLAKSMESESKRHAQVLQLAIGQWFKKVEASIQSQADEECDWPIMDATKCFCGAWIAHERHEGLFEAGWLAQLIVAHEKLHSVGDSLRKLYHEGKTQAALDGLSVLREEMEKVEAFLNEAE